MLNNKKVNQISKLVLVILFVATPILLAWMSFGSGYASAESGDQRTKGLTISPLRTEIEIAPGISQAKTLSITNNNKTPIAVRLSAEEFSVINQQYDYAFNVETQLSKWVTFTPDTLELAVGETKTAIFRVGVPINAEPGGRYISMFATTDASASNDGVASRQRVASLIYMTVSGEVSRSGKLATLNSPWFMTGPSDWTVTLQNTGSTHYRSRYNVVVYPLLGDGEIARVNGDVLILPGTVRLVKDKIPHPGLPGIYKVVYTIGLGDTPAEVQTRYIVYLPPVAIIVSVFAIILILSLISEYRSRTKKRQSV